MERWDLYDQNRQLTGREIVRGEKIPKRFYHLTIHAWIRNSQGQYLISQHSANRPTFPLMWECVGGSVIKGENSLHGAIREIQEEVGLTLSPNDGRMIASVVGRTVNGVKIPDILDIWLFNYDGPVTLKLATTHEVAQVSWMTKKRIKYLFDSGKFVPTLGYFFEMKDF